MKKLICLAMAVAMLLCSTAMAKGDRLEKIKEAGEITLVTEPYWAPNEFIDPSKEGDEQYVGSDIELAKYIADKIGVSLKIVPLEFGAVLTGIVEGKYDMAISAIAWSPVREEAMALSDGYEFDDSGYGFVVAPGNEGKYNTIESLKDAVVVTQSGSVQEAIYNNYCGNAKELKLVGSMTDAYLAVSEGKADVCITNLASAKLYQDANSSILVVDGFKFDVDPRMTGTCVALPLDGSESLMAIVNECIAELTEAGQFQQWSDFYKEYAKTLGI